MSSTALGQSSISPTVSCVHSPVVWDHLYTLSYIPSKPPSISGWHKSKNCLWVLGGPSPSTGASSLSGTTGLKSCSPAKLAERYPPEFYRKPTKNNSFTFHIYSAPCPHLRNQFSKVIISHAYFSNALKVPWSDISDTFLSSWLQIHSLLWRIGPVTSKLHISSFCLLSIRVIFLLYWQLEGLLLIWTSHILLNFQLLPFTR